MRQRLSVVIGSAMLWLAILLPAGRADTAIGDWGHFLVAWPVIYVNNPDGRPFTVTFHAMRWGVPEWNRAKMRVRVTSPQGAILKDDAFPITNAACALAFPRGEKGVYKIEPNFKKTGEGGWGSDPSIFWFESSLNQSVVWTGDPLGHAIEGHHLVAQCAVPRRYWFWVPRGVKQFICRAERSDRFMSQREDWGITLFSPRGQRVRMLWGDASLDATPWKMAAAIPVEPGASGRFWMMEMRNGDSHNYSKPNFSLDGIPPYLARCPEEWFDPSTGSAPAIDPYDDDPFMQFARTEKNKEWPWLDHFSPVPSLGDPDGIEIRGDARFALWNPQNRDLRFRIGSYLPRTMMGGAAPSASILFTSISGRTIHSGTFPIEHLHGDHGAPAPFPNTGAMPFLASVKGVERWFAFTYPALPLVLIGEDASDGWKRYRFEVGTARHWYFLVPRGTKSFALRFSAAQPTDVLYLEVNTPDRVLDLVYANQAERTIAVPPGMDGKIWHLRTDVGGATRMILDGNVNQRYQGIDLTIETKGIPEYLSPSWEQWFSPRDARSANARRDQYVLGK